MNTATSFSSSWLGSSPSRQSPTRNGLRSHRSSLIRDPQESPTRQIQLDFQFHLTLSDRDFNRKLDHDAAERARLHQEQLAKAALEHQRVQEEAEREIERIRLEEEQARLRKEMAQREELERLKQEKIRQEAEAQRKELEAKRREEEAAQKAAEHRRQLQETEARIKAQKEQEEASRKQHEENERKAREAAEASKAAAQQQKTQPVPVAQPQAAPAVTAAPIAAAPQSTPSQAPAASADILQVHQKYLELHTGMKQFRKQFLEAHKEKGDPLKPHIGDLRRNMNKRLGQITVELKDSKAAITAIRSECFDKAVSIQGPTIDIRPYIMSDAAKQITNDAEAQYPQLLLYAWICLEKTLIHQWYNEASKEDGRIIGQLGLIAASLYLDSKYMWKGSVSMIDTLLAKLHRISPMMFGIRGDMDNNRAGLGLDKFPINDDAEMNRYSQRLMGVGAGYAAISHRKFPNKPPAIPLSEYWRVVVSICNTPTDALYAGHFLCLQGLLRDHIKKFLATYGIHARAVLRRAVFDLPNRIPQGRKGVAEAASLVKVLPDTWKAKDGINIA